MALARFVGVLAFLDMVVEVSASGLERRDESDEDCGVSYEDRGGKYQNQQGLTYSRL